MLKIQDNNSIIKYSARINLITKDNLGYIASQRLKKTLIINKSSLENLILKLETLIGIHVYFFFKLDNLSILSVRIFLWYINITNFILAISSLIINCLLEFD